MNRFDFTFDVINETLNTLEKEDRHYLIEELEEWILNYKTGEKNDKKRTN